MAGTGRERAFLMSRIPTNADGSFGSWTGKREYPLATLKLIHKTLLRERHEGDLHEIDGLMIENHIRAQSQHVLFAQQRRSKTSDRQ